MSACRLTRKPLAEGYAMRAWLIPTGIPSRLGRKPRITARQRRSIVWPITANPYATLAEELQDLKDVATSTLKMIAKSESIVRRVPLRKPALSKRNIQARCAWAKQYKDVDWRKVLYTDETAITISSRNSRSYTSIRKRQPRNRTHHNQNGWESLLPWAGIGYNFKTPSALIDLVTNYSDERKCMFA